MISGNHFYNSNYIFKIKICKKRTFLQINKRKKKDRFLEKVFDFFKNLVFKTIWKKNEVASKMLSNFHQVLDLLIITESKESPPQD